MESRQTSPPIPHEQAEERFDVLDLVDAAPPRIDGVVIGRLDGFGADGVPLVDFGPNPSGEAVAARSTVALEAAHVGREVALLFERGDPRRPLVVGLLWQPAPSPSEVSVRADGEQLTLTAEREVVLRCGKASLTLTRAGKVILRGTYVLSRSSGVNRIKGGSVEIN